MILVMCHTTTILQGQTADTTVVLSDHNEAEEFLSLSDILGKVTSQLMASWVCGDVEVNKPTVPSVIEEYNMCNYVLPITPGNRQLGYWIVHFYSVLAIIWKYTATYQKPPHCSTACMLQAPTPPICFSGLLIASGAQAQG